MCGRCGRDMEDVPAIFNEHGFEVLCVECFEVLAGAVQEGEAIKEEKEQKYISKKAGDYITSERRFGVEFEINLNGAGIDALRDLVAHDYGVVHDGSVNAGIEVVTPILGGAKGEKEIIKTCDLMQQVKAGADESCGLHIHMDAPDFYSKRSSPVVSLSDARRMAKDKKYSEHKFLVLHSSAVKELKTFKGGDLYNAIIRNRTIDQFHHEEWLDFADTLHQYTAIFTDGLKTAKSFFVVAPTGARGGTRIPASTSITNLEQIKKHKGDMVLMHQAYSEYAVIDEMFSRGELVIVLSMDKRTRDNEVDRLKRLASFYVAFDDIIVSTLPCDRRDNDYASRLSTRMSLSDIDMIDTILDFFQLWTKTKTLNGFLRSLQNQRHESRYHGINFTSLLKHGTIEVRYHGGTTSAEKTLHWLVLHQAIVDKCADLQNRRFDLDRLFRASMVIDREAKTDLFFKKLALPDATEQYFRNRINKFLKEDKNMVDYLLADDNTNN